MSETLTLYVLENAASGGTNGMRRCSPANTDCSTPNLMCPETSRREVTPVRNCSVRLSWRLRARPSTTLHEIQICRSRLEYIVCNTPHLSAQTRLEISCGQKCRRRRLLLPLRWGRRSSAPNARMQVSCHEDSPPDRPGTPRRLFVRLLLPHVKAW